MGMHINSKQVAFPNVHEIKESFLSDPKVDYVEDKHYLGRVCFGIVKLQLYRGIHVAVKELLPVRLRKM